MCFAEVAWFQKFWFLCRVEPDSLFFLDGYDVLVYRLKKEEITSELIKFVVVEFDVLLMLLGNVGGVFLPCGLSVEECLYF
jgi:hypothetical protein